MSILVFEDVRKSYGKKVALHGLSFSVEPGEVLGLLGPNGAGKTTTLRILMDVIRADSGAIQLFGAPFRAEALDSVGYLPEERGLYAKHKVIDVMTYFGALKGLRNSELRPKARVWLEKVGLHDIEHLPVDRLSKGMGQKVQIAATLQSDPELCILDEPFSGLDPVNTVLIRDLISERRRSGKTTILSTHQMSMVETLCDRVALLSDGHRVVYGAVEDVRREHSLPEVRVKLSAERLPELRGIAHSQRESARTWRLRLEPGTRSRDVLTQLVQGEADVERFEDVLASMEDIFIRVVKRSEGGARALD